MNAFLLASIVVIVTVVGTSLSESIRIGVCLAAPATRPVRLPQIVYEYAARSSELRYVVHIEPDGSMKTIKESGNGPAVEAMGKLSAAETRLLSEMLSGVPEKVGPWAMAGNAEFSHTLSLDGRTLRWHGIEVAEPFGPLLTTLSALANQRVIPDVDMATAADLDVVVTRTQPLRQGAASPTTLRALLTNKSQRPLRVYVPAFVGPNQHDPKDGRGKRAPERRVGPQFGANDYVVLRPGEFIGRTGSLPAERSHHEVRAFYTVYAPGKEGRSDSVLDVVHGVAAAAAGNQT